MGMLRRWKKENQSSNGYSRIEEWDPEERIHREAQFLIYKTLQKAEQVIAKQSRSTTCCRFIRLRFCKVGRRLKRGVISTLSKAKSKAKAKAKGWPWLQRPKAHSVAAAAGFCLPTPLID